MSSSNSEKMINRGVGCLLGQVVGDALGTRYEFKSSKTVESLVKKDMGNTNHLKILGEGPFNVALGQVTDDSELAFGLARSLIAKNSFNIVDIANNYTIWFKSPPFDIGQTTRNAFYGSNLKNTPKQNYDNIIKNAKESNANSLSNGCLMRISPLAIAGSRWTMDELIEAAKLDCSLTNPNPVALDAVSVYVAAIRTAILTGDREQVYLKALEIAQTPTIQKILEDAVDGAQPIIIKKGGRTLEVNTDSGEFQGFLGVALQNAFFELMNGVSFEKSLVNVIKRGGDTDTNGCICGALLGALYGAENIPTDWWQAVVNAKTERRQKQYPLVKTSDLYDVALSLIGTPQQSIKRPVIIDFLDTIPQEGEDAEDANDSD